MHCRVYLDLRSSRLLSVAFSIATVPAKRSKSKFKLIFVEELLLSMFIGFECQLNLCSYIVTLTKGCNGINFI